MDFNVIKIIVYKLKGSKHYLNFTWSLFDQIIRLFVSIIIGAIVARKLGVIDYGILSFFITYFSLFNQLTGLSFESQLISKVIINPESENEYWGSYLFARLLISVILITISIFIFYAFFADKYKQSNYIIAIGVISILFKSLNIYEVWFQAKGLQYLTIKSKIVSNLTINIFKLLVAFYYPNITVFLFVFSLDIFLNTYFIFTVFKSISFTSKWSYSYNKIKGIIKNSLILILSSLLIYLYSRIDVFFIKYYLSDHDLGIYTAAVTISSFIPIGALIAYNILIPVVSNKKKINDVIYLDYLQNLFKYFFVAGVILSLLVYIFSNFIISTIFGEMYLESILILKIHVFTNVFIFLGIVQNIWLSIENKGNLILIRSIVGLCISITLNYYFLDMYGIISCAVISLFVQLISSFLLNRLTCKQIFKMQAKAFIFFI